MFNGKNALRNLAERVELLESHRRSEHLQERLRQAERLNEVLATKLARFEILHGTVDRRGPEVKFWADQVAEMQVALGKLKTEQANADKYLDDANKRFSVLNRAAIDLAVLVLSLEAKPEDEVRHQLPAAIAAAKKLVTG